MPPDVLTAAVLDPIEDISRRGLLVTAFAAAFVAACGGGDDDGQRATEGDTPAYPRDVEHFSGTTRLNSSPTRIVTVTNTYDLDAVLALGVAPVHMGLRQGLGSFTGGDTISWPWHEEALRDLGAQPGRQVVGAAGPDIERIVATRPDLIVTTLYLPREAVGLLEQIAPVIDVSSDWRRNLRIMGHALDKAPAAEGLIEQTDEKIRRALDGLGLDAPTVALVYPGGDGSIRVPAHPADSRVDLFQRAGFRISPALTALATPEAPLATISAEGSKLFDDAELIVLLKYQPAAAEAWLANPLAQSLPAVKKGKVLPLEQGAVGQGITFFGPLNVDVILPFVRRAGEIVRA